MREYFLTNRDMSSQPTLLNALKSDGIWTAPSKDPYLPKYVYSLCQEYMKLPKDSRRKRIPVTVSIRVKPQHQRIPLTLNIGIKAPISVFT